MQGLSMITSAMWVGQLGWAANELANEHPCLTILYEQLLMLQCAGIELAAAGYEFFVYLLNTSRPMYINSLDGQYRYAALNTSCFNWSLHHHPWALVIRIMCRLCIQ
jgi:hypothetical protein